MKVSLVNLNQPTVYHKHSVRLSKRVWQPITLGILASLLRQSGDVPLILDANAMDWSNEILVEKVRDAYADVLVIATDSHDRWLNPFPDIDRVLSFEKLLREQGPPYPFLVIIGPQGTLLPDQLLSGIKLPGLLIRGEPESVFPDVIEGVKNDKWKDVSSISFRTGNGYQHNEGDGFVQELDALPLPAYDLLPMEKYRLRESKRSMDKQRFALMTTSRGCPYGCSFCNLSMHGRGYRTYSIERALEEIDLLVRKYEVNSIMFHDLTFVVDRKRTESFCRALIERKYSLSWICQSRAQNADLELLKLMKEAGCEFIEVGIESGHKNQHKGHKKLAIDKTEEFIRNCKAAGLGVSPGHLLGLPGDDEDKVRESVRFLKSKGLPFRLTHTVVPYPGTDNFEIGLKEGKIRDRDWKSIQKAAGKVGNRFTDEDLERIFQDVNRKQVNYIILRGLPRAMFDSNSYVLFFSSFVNDYKEGRNIIRAFLEGARRVYERLERLLYKVY